MVDWGKSGKTLFAATYPHVYSTYGYQTWNLQSSTTALGYTLKASGNATQFGKYDRKPWAGQNLVGGVTPEISDKCE